MLLIIMTAVIGPPTDFLRIWTEAIWSLFLGARRQIVHAQRLICGLLSDWRSGNAALCVSNTAKGVFDKLSVFIYRRIDARNVAFANQP